jgi:hypothetical protein
LKAQLDNLKNLRLEREKKELTPEQIQNKRKYEESIVRTAEWQRNHSGGPDLALPIVLTIGGKKKRTRRNKRKIKKSTKKSRKSRKNNSNKKK